MQLIKHILALKGFFAFHLPSICKSLGSTALLFRNHLPSVDNLSNYLFCLSLLLIIMQHVNPTLIHSLNKFEQVYFRLVAEVPSQMYKSTHTHKYHVFWPKEGQVPCLVKNKRIVINKKKMCHYVSKVQWMWLSAQRQLVFLLTPTGCGSSCIRFQLFLSALTMSQCVSPSADEWCPCYLRLS